MAEFLRKLSCACLFQEDFARRKCIDSIHGERTDMHSFRVVAETFICLIIPLIQPASIVAGPRHMEISPHEEEEGWRQAQVSAPKYNGIMSMCFKSQAVF